MEPEKVKVFIGALIFLILFIPIIIAATQVTQILDAISPLIDTLSTLGAGWFG